MPKGNETPKVTRARRTAAEIAADRMNSAQGAIQKRLEQLQGMREKLESQLAKINAEENELNTLLGIDQPSEPEK
jgi:peptidoglycan hydrolase CwlO-like protein